VCFKGVYVCVSRGVCVCSRSVLLPNWQCLKGTCACVLRVCAVYSQGRVRVSPLVRRLCVHVFMYFGICVGMYEVVFRDVYRQVWRLCLIWGGYD